MINLQTTRRFEELLVPDVEPSPYEYSLLFKAEGWRDRMRSKERFKLLRGIDAKLRSLLHDGERVYFVTSGTTSAVAEQFFAGASIARALNRRALVFTTERVILLQIDSKRRPRDLVSQIAYTSITAVKATWTGYCQLSLVDKSKLSFAGVPQADRKHLAAFLADIVKATAQSPFAIGTASLEHLCPHCFSPVSGHPDACPHCQRPFKLARVAMLRSLLFPGLGDFYLGHRLFAAMEAFGAALFWYVMVIIPLLGVPDESGSVVEPDSTYWVTTAIMLAIMHGIDAVMTRHFALKGHHPA